MYFYILSISSILIDKIVELDADELGQRLANYNPLVESGTLPVFANTVLLEHSHALLLMNFLFLLLHSTVELSGCIKNHTACNA